MRQHAIKVYRLRAANISSESIAASVAANAANDVPLTQSSMGISAGTVGIPGIAIDINSVMVAPPIRCIAVSATARTGVRLSSGFTMKSTAAMTIAEKTLGAQPADVSQSSVVNP